MRNQALIFGFLVIIEFIQAVAASIIPTHELLGIVFDPIVLNTVTSTHAEVSLFLSCYIVFAELNFLYLWEFITGTGNIHEYIMLSQAMQKEQLAAVHLHPRVRLSDDDLRPRDYEDFEDVKEHPKPVPLLKESRCNCRRRIVRIIIPDVLHA
jgi:hypothetical protein